MVLSTVILASCDSKSNTQIAPLRTYSDYLRDSKLEVQHAPPPPAQISESYCESNRIMTEALIADALSMDIKARGIRDGAGCMLLGLLAGGADFGLISSSCKLYSDAVVVSDGNLDKRAIILKIIDENLDHRCASATKNTTSSPVESETRVDRTEGATVLETTVNEVVTPPEEKIASTVEPVTQVAEAETATKNSQPHVTNFETTKEIELPPVLIIIGPKPKED